METTFRTCNDYDADAGDPRGIADGNILIIDSNRTTALATEFFLQRIDTALKITICADTPAALEALARQSWRRILLDIGMPGSAGLSLAQHCCELGHAKKSVVVTDCDHLHLRVQAYSMGLLGYLLKNGSMSEFTSGLNAMLAGRRVFPPALADQTAPVRLSPRQREALNLLYRGLEPPDIAMSMGINRGTVDNYISQSQLALGANNRMHAVTLAAQMGYINIHKVPVA